MKIIKTKYENGDFMYEGSIEIELETFEGSKSVSFGHGEPEDNCLARDLSDALWIDTMLVMAYNAGKKGETLEIINEIEE
jgi:hypothetical protein